MAKVVLTNVNKVYDNKVHVVKDANLHIKDKEFMVFVGPSGCGKSTTLRMIAGLEEITGGTINIGERVINDVLPKDRDIAMVFQNYALYPHMTVYENLAFGLRLRKFSKKEIDERVQEAATILGLEDYLQRRPKQLSGGQRQRVAVGRAIVRHPQVFLFDEPLSNLDAKLRVQMRAEINRLHKKLRTTMIYVTHDQVEAMTMGDRITVLKDGVIQQVDTPLNLYDHPKNKFVAGFIGSPAMNFINGKIIESNNDFKFSAAGVESRIHDSYIERMKSYKDKKVFLGIRPEHLFISETPDFEATVEVVELMGSEVYVYCNLNGTKILAKLITRDIPKVDQKLKFEINHKMTHFFAEDTEESITFDLEK